MAFSGFNTNALMPTPIQAANPLEMAGQVLSVKNALLGNKIQQAEYDARMAQGNALLGATDASGRTDYAKARAAMAANPAAAAYGAADAFQGQNVARQQDLANQDKNLSFQEHARDAVAGAFIRAAQNPTDANIRGAGAFIAHLTPQASQQIATTTQDLLALKTPEQREEAIKTLATSTLPGHERITAAFGSPTIVDDGNTIQSGTQGSALDGGAFTPAAGMQRQVSPESNAQLVQRIVMIDGRPTHVWTTAGEIRGAAPSGFTGRTVDTSGASGGEPVLAGAPAGTEDLVKTGQGMQNALAAQQGDVSQNIATLENLNGLLGRLNGQQFRGQTMATIANNLSKLKLGGDYATLHQEIDKAATQLRKQMVEGGGFPHTNAGLADLEHMSPSAEMTPTAARALTNELLTAAQYQRGRQRVAASIKDPTKVMQALAAYDQAFDPRFATIQRLGPEEGREYARSHISDPREYAASVRRMAQAQRDSGYDYGLTPAQIGRILGEQNGR